MSDIGMIFGMCSVVVIEDGSTFKGVFILMCKHLKILYWCISRGNHLDNSVERYHRLLNKTQAIAGTDRGTNQVILQNAKIIQYAWNSSPIDNTYISRSLAAVRRELDSYWTWSYHQYLN